MAKSDIADQIAQNMRLYSDMRFKQLTLLLAWFAIAGGGISQYGEKIIVMHTALKVIVSVASLLVTAVVWVMEIRSSVLWAQSRKVIPDHWPGGPDVFLPWINATSAVLGFYVAAYAFWILCVFEWSSTYIIPFVGLAAGIFLIVFSVENYRRCYFGKKP